MRIGPEAFLARYVPNLCLDITPQSGQGHRHVVDGAVPAHAGEVFGRRGTLTSCPSTSMVCVPNSTPMVGLNSAWGTTQHRQQHSGWSRTQPPTHSPEGTCRLWHSTQAAVTGHAGVEGGTMKESVVRRRSTLLLPTWLSPEARGCHTVSLIPQEDTVVRPPPPPHTHTGGCCARVQQRMPLDSTEQQQLEQQVVRVGERGVQSARNPQADQCRLGAPPPCRTVGRHRPLRAQALASQAQQMPPVSRPAAVMAQAGLAVQACHHAAIVGTCSGAPSFCTRPCRR